MSLPEALEAAASALAGYADAIRPANGDPTRVLSALGPDAAAEVLGWLLAERPAAGEELALAWADLEGGAGPIERAAAGSLDKTARKALRRALHRLRSRGVALTESPAAPRVATLPPLADEIAVALVSPPDPSGAQLVVLTEPSPSGGVRIFEGAVDLERGVLEFRVLQASRSQARRLLRSLTRHERLAATPASREAVAALLARAASAQPADRALPAAFGDWRNRVARPPAGAATPGDAARAAFPSADPLPSVLREVAEAVAAGALGPWPPEPAAVQALAEKVRDTASSRLLVNEAQRRTQVDAVLADAAGERYAGAAADRTAGRLEECAFAAWQRGREDEARRLVAAARAFRERPPRENPVARALLERALGPVLEVLRDEQDASLLVRP
jgi:hypothetical protein